MKRRGWSAILFLLTCCGAEAVLPPPLPVTTIIFSTPGVTPSIGASADLPALPSAAQWSAFSPVTPANGETVTINPPLFNWLYSPSNGNAGAADTNIYNFIFQADYTGSFSSPVVNVSNAICGYNYLAPFTSNTTVYWRVGYVPVYSQVTNFWLTNNFFVAATATNWDRSSFADPAYMTGHCAHPHMLFNATNAGLVYAAILASNLTSWSALTNDAYANITSAWWTNTNQWINLGSFSPDAATRGIIIMEAAMAYDFTSNAVWSNTLAANFDRQVNYFVSSGDWNSDMSAANDYSLWSIALGYDWLYSILTTAQRTNALGAMDMICHNDLFGAWRWQPVSNSGTNAPYYAPSSILYKLSTSHYFLAAMFQFPVALSAYSDLADAQLLFDTDLNYMLARKTPWGSCGANNQSQWWNNYVLQNTFFNAMLWSAISFPEEKLNSDPYWSKFADWAARKQPAGFNEVHGQFADGEVSPSLGVTWQIPASYEMALFAGSGVMSNQISSAYSVEGGTVYNFAPNVITVPYFFAQPTPTTNTPLAQCYAVDGQVLGSSLPPGTTGVFTNGVGFCIQARPQGGNWAHNFAGDGDFQIWAYGAQITDAPGGNYGVSGSPFNKTSWSHNTIAVNGLGQVNTDEGPVQPVCSKIIAFTNAPDYAYTALDCTYSYPHTNWLFAGDPQGLYSTNYSNLYTNGLVLANLTRVQRHLLFLHHQYFVIYDDLAATNAVNWNFIYRVLWNSVSNFDGAGNFNYTCPTMSHLAGQGYQYSFTPSVKVYAAQMMPGVLATNYTGSNAYINPYTGENYYSIAVYDYTNNGNILSTNMIWETSPPTNAWHFMTVLYPCGAGTNAPTISSLDGYTALVTAGTNTDIVCFNTNSAYAAAATTLVDVAGISANAH